MQRFIFLRRDGKQLRKRNLERHRDVGVFGEDTIVFDLSDRKFPFEGFGFQGVIHVSNVGLEFLPHFFGRRYVADAAVRRGTAHPHARDKACHLIDPAHIKYDYENENGEQAAGEEEEVLRPQPLELHLAAHAFIDRIFGHRLKEKRTQNRGGDDQEDTGSEPARSGFRRIRIARTELLVDGSKYDVTICVAS